MTNPAVKRRGAVPFALIVMLATGAPVSLRVMVPVILPPPALGLRSPRSTVIAPPVAIGVAELPSGTRRPSASPL